MYEILVKNETDNALSNKFSAYYSEITNEIVDGSLCCF